MLDKVGGSLRGGRAAILLVCAVFNFAQLARAQYAIRAVYANEEIEIDGALTESSWSAAPPIDTLTQYEPSEGVPFSQPTEVRALYDERRVYFAFTCYDDQMSRVIANEMRRDGQLHNNDSVFVLLDTYNDRRSAFFFRVNPLGAMEDAAISDNGDTRNEDWNAVWEAAARMEDDHWTAEMAIPFSQLRFQRNGPVVWGLNVGRTLKRANEEGIWYPRTKADGFLARYKTTTLGELTGPDGISSTRNLELLPYLLPGATKAEGETTSGKFELGLDAKYGLTSNLTADLTFNTDFAQVEADDEQVNLTRFDLFFPEKRPFFLEGASRYDFGIGRSGGRRPPPILLFYSRRIGLFEGDAVPIIVGGKITGKFGPYSVGALDVMTDRATVMPGEDDEEGEVLHAPRRNYSVLRLKRDVLSQSSVGVIAVNQDDADGHNRAGGFDFQLRPSTRLSVRGLWARTSDSETGDGDAWLLRQDWDTGQFSVESSIMEIGRDFNPEVGFVQREAIRRYELSARYTPWPQKFGIRSVFTGPQADFVYDLDGRLLTRELSYFGWFEREAGGSFRGGVWSSFELLDEDFEIRDGVVIPAGEYEFTTARMGFQTEEGRSISVEIDGNYGQFFNGDRRGVQLELTLKPNPQLGLEGRYEFNHIDLPAGSFNANALSSRIVYAFNTDLFAKLFTQWNGDNRIMTTNFLLNYIYRPGSDFYLAFNRTYDFSGATTELVDAALVGKMTYWWNP